MMILAVSPFFFLFLFELATATHYTITNQCGFQVLIWEVFDAAPSAPIMIAPSGQHTAPYGFKADLAGPAVKISRNSDYRVDITQLEYTLGDEHLFYDVSNIDGYPFLNEGLTLGTSIASCPVVSCPPGERFCSAAYNTPTDDWATRACNLTAQLLLTLCK